ncbi:four-carbon acid sugar kinase family protein [Piscibacillus halophilus]|uniref:Uncharacterized conserved protein YgbK, DUF1537 family n=1 Tax=Piscibacillus halophilus TaxID=571933 RepID=A0A1H9HU20_9BACI|nr:four-carbon acid sugar kinase family protein [Piscibacillus halophilus]SEQ65775.1 Uncharacterized conserved protein YgbK, DUF1537 family [Piscibacillus halophilus]
MEKLLGIIADDFTGANDTGIQLSKKGYSTNVLVDLPKDHINNQAQVTIIDTDTRAASPDQAQDKVKKVASFLQINNINQFYKKVDSTLRGQVGAEILALEEAVTPDVVVIAPAYPSLGRVTTGGVHYVDGQPVAETEFGRDPKTPVKDSRIIELLKPYGKERITPFVPGDDVESVEEKLNQGQKWFVCDVEEDQDLRTITNVFSELNLNILWVGSAGLIEFIDFELDHEGVVSEFSASDSSSHVLTVSGSLSQKTKSQLIELSKLDHVQTLEVSPIDLLNGNVLKSSDLDQLWTKQDVLLFVDSSDKNIEEANQYREQYRLTKEEVGLKISQGLAIITKEMVKKFSINHMILTGGDTAKAVCSELGISVLELVKEIETGIPLGKAQLNGVDQWIVTKAGGFGNEQSLVHATKFLKGMKHHDE